MWSGGSAASPALLIYSQSPVTLGHPGLLSGAGRWRGSLDPQSAGLKVTWTIPYHLKIGNSGVTPWNLHFVYIDVWELPTCPSFKFREDRSQTRRSKSKAVDVLGWEALNGRERVPRINQMCKGWGHRVWQHKGNAFICLRRANTVFL